MLASSAIISINVAKCDMSDNIELYSHGSRYLVIYPTEGKPDTFYRFLLEALLASARSIELQLYLGL